MADDVAELNPSLIMAAQFNLYVLNRWYDCSAGVGAVENRGWGDDDLLEAGLDYVRDTPLDKFLKDASLC